MCGLAGWVGGEATYDIDSAIRAMTDRIRHRGPDDVGVWHDLRSEIVLGHRRLSVLDLSSAGHQPMLSHCGRYVLAFNGEIYNHLAIRGELDRKQPNIKWTGHSDTETILAALSEWGIERTLKSLVGMFAIALWDRQECVLTLARDRAGEKPLYYGRQGRAVLFGSELKSLKAHPSFAAPVDRRALALLLRHNCVPAPYSIYEGIHKLPPGHLLQVSPNSESLEPVAFWDLNSVIETGLHTPFQGSETDAIGELDRLLRASIKGQMLSDVPLGAFLSGGIDSSCIVALMQKESSQRIKTFTIGFEKSDYNEALSAKAVAEHIGTDHTELYVQPADALSVVESLPSIYCEPFGDSSQIPTFLVSNLARSEVTVALSGDGGDELFGGYNRYLLAKRVWGGAQKLPGFARRMVRAGLRAVPPTAWDRAAGVIGPLLPRRMRLTTFGDKAQKLSEVLDFDDGRMYHYHLASHWKNPSAVVLGAQEPPTLLTNTESHPAVDCLEHYMMAMDAQTYLPDDILVKVDRAAMANSLETRVPLLDHRIIEFAWRLPLSLKIRDNQGKWLLRQVLDQYVPRELIERPKAGFSIPLDSWLRGPLREWAEDMLDEHRLRSEGYFEATEVRKKWDQHLSGQRNWQYHLWTVLMFQAWLQDEAVR